MRALLQRWRHYGDGKRTTEQRRRRRENRGRKTVRNDDGKGLIARLRSARKPRRSLLRTSATPKMATTVTGSLRKVAGGDTCPLALFHIITELPFAKIHKLLPILCNNSKISKNKSCSKSKVLQLCFYNHPLIRSTF